MTYLTAEDQPETAMLMAAEAENTAYTQQNSPDMTGKTAKELAQKVQERWGIRQAQWYKWQEIGGKAKKAEDGSYYLDPEQIGIYDYLRSHLDESPDNNYKTFQAQLDKEMVREAEAEIVPVDQSAIAQECAEAEFTEEVERRGIPRSIQERAAIMQITEYRIASSLGKEHLDPDLQEAIAREEEAFMGKLDRARTPEQMEDAIASMMSQFQAA